MRTNIETAEFMINVRRPNIEDENRAFWKAFHQMIEEIDIPIQVNSMFNYLKKVSESNENYFGSGYQYCFWFNSENDKQTFIEALNNLCISHNVSKYNE